MQLITDNQDCPLCGGTGLVLQETRFYRCPTCSGIFRSRTDWPKPQEEKARYKLHNNDPDDPGYRSFVSPITSSIVNDFPSVSKGLDFGSGTGSSVAAVLREKGYQIELYDPFFYPDSNCLNQSFDFIACCEVIEHFHHPHKEFNLLKTLLNPGGKLYCMTHPYSDTTNFKDWYYAKDPTHVFFYSWKCLEWIKSHFGFRGLSMNKRLIVFDA